MSKVSEENGQLKLKQMLSLITVMDTLDTPDTVMVSPPDTLVLEVTTWEREKLKLNLTTVMVSVTTAVVTMEVTVTVTVMAMVTTVRSYKNL